MPDRVFIEGLAIETVIGVYDWEKEIRQRVVLDLELDTGLAPAGVSDALADTVDYRAVADRLIALVGGARFELLEALGEAICNCLLREFPVRRVRLKLSKPGAVAEAANVGIRIERPAAEPAGD